MTTNENRSWEPSGKPAYTIAEVAGLLGVHRATVSGFIKAGDLRVARLGHRTIRITHDAVMDFLKSREVPVVENQARRSGGESGQAS